MAHLTTCPDCGCDDFVVIESHVTPGRVHDCGTLVYSGTTDQFAVDSAVCCGCDRDFPPDAFAAVAMGETCPKCDPMSP